MSCGIYKITNILNGHVYIGQSINIEKRWQDHKREARTEGFPQYNYTIHQAFRKYGLDNFSFEILEECEQSLLNEKERFWISFYDSYKNGYNETEGGDGGPIMKGEDNPRAKLTDDDVFDIRSRALKCESQSEVYQQLYTDKISKRQFERIWQGEGWDHILLKIQN